jgi:hypothetical protein
MTDKINFFRDFGIVPTDLAPPAGPIRSYLPWWHIIGQYLGTAFMMSLGVGMALIFVLGLPAPLNWLCAPVLPAVLGTFMYRAACHDYAWVELDGHRLRARHLYSQRLSERQVEDIDDLLTLTFPVVNVTVAIVETLLGRVRGIEIRFRDGRNPLRVLRADPAMKNAKALIEAVIYRMSQTGKIDAEVIELDGKPMIRRIFWAGADALADGTPVRRPHFST